MRYFQLAFFTALFSSGCFAQQSQWVINNELVDYQNNTKTALPTSNSPDHTQNGLVNSQGILEFYAADGTIYDGNGNIILQQSHDAPPPGFSEFIFAPVPETCDEYYCISTFHNHYLVYSRIKKIGGVWIAQVIPAVLGKTAFYESNNCIFTRSNAPLPSSNSSTNSVPKFDNHLAVTRENINGNRYLVVATTICLSVFEIRNSDIVFLSSSNKIQGFQRFQPNNRSEIEVFEYASSGNNESFTVATCYIAKPDLSASGAPNYSNLGGAVHLHEVSFISGTPSFGSEYQVAIPKPASLANYKQSVNGIEFSEDGLSLFASVAYYQGSGPVTFANHSNVVYFSRPNFSTNFSYVGPILSGTSTQDFGQGQIERGLDNKMYIAGNGRIGAWADNNDPTSTFTANAVAVNNRLTKGKHYLDPIIIAYKNIASMWLYLLPDQVDGEDYSTWEYGPNNFPDLIENCIYPHTLNLPGSFFMDYQELGLPPANQYLTYGNQIIISKYSQLIVSKYVDFSCPETLVVKCCPEPASELQCDPVIDVTETFDHIAGTVTICGTTCTWDVPPPCSYNWSFNYVDDGGILQTYNSTSYTFCTTITIAEYNRSYIDVHLVKILCLPMTCGDDIIVDFNWPLHSPE